MMRFRLSPKATVIIVILIAPILFTIVVYPNTFNQSWGGRGGFLFAIAFIAAELFGVNHIIITRKRLFILIGLCALAITYFVGLAFGVRDVIINDARYYSWNHSWIMMWDFIVMTIYVISSLVVLFGRKWYKVASASTIYLAGIAIIFSLDAFFPHGTLGPLQSVVPIYLQIDQDVIRFINNHIMRIGVGIPATADGNHFALNGLHGSFDMIVFWPSAGIQNMIIYSLVILAFLLKMEIPIRRKLAYFILGTMGTASVNVIQITSLSVFTLISTTNEQKIQGTFHSLTGEMMFIPWLGIYLAGVMYIEAKVGRKLQGGATVNYQ
jgi:thaumarchaeosortase